MGKKIGELIRFNVPENLTETKYTKILIDKTNELLERVGDELVPESALDNGKKLIEALPRVLPGAEEYRKILKKYGYLPQITDPVAHVLELVRGKCVDDKLIEKIYDDFYTREAYNVFTALANVPPTSLAKPFEQLIIDVTRPHVEITPPVTIDGTPSNRYDAYIPDYNVRVEVKTTRLIDSTKNGDMGKRFLPYGAGRKFTTSIKQVKLKYFDLLVMNIAAANVNLYALYTRDDIEKIIIENFVGKSSKKMFVSLIHNTEATPKTKEKRLEKVWTSEFILYFQNYRAMADMLSYARFVTFDPKELGKAVARESKKFKK